MIDNNYFLIRTLKQNIVEVRCLYASNNIKGFYKYPLCFIVNYDKLSHISILLSLFLHLHLCSTEHKMYLGKEIYKIKISIVLNQIYVQS